MDPDPAIFVIDLQDANKKQKKNLLITFEGTITSFSKIKSQKESQNIGIEVFLTIFSR
jgi:hypothetical protein